MSFILDSIKKAERERKLGQEVPSISVEYSYDPSSHTKNNYLLWAWLSLGFVAIAIIVWAATYYLTRQDYTYRQEVLKKAETTVVPKVSEVKAMDFAKHDIVMVPLKNIHQSSLKTIQLINEEDQLTEQNTPDALSPYTQTGSRIAERVAPEINHNEKKPNTGKETAKVTNPVISKQAAQLNAKRKLAAIYHDMAEFVTKNESNTLLVKENYSNSEKLLPELMHIEEANYTATEFTPIEAQQEFARKATGTTPPVVQVTAVNSGVPSFGELPYDIQEQIPDFNVSVHMFHNDPTQRRIRINGNMYTEGKRLQQDLALVEITRFGAVFDYQGHKFRINVR